MRPLALAGAILVSIVAPWTARAAPPADAATTLSFVAAPIFGAEAAAGTGWNEVVTRVDNTGQGAQRGAIELWTTEAWGSGEPTLAARAPFAVPAGKSAIVALPLRGFGGYAPRTKITATNAEGGPLAEVAVTFGASTGPLLVEVAETARLSSAVRGWPVDAKWERDPTPGSDALTVGTPGFDRATGDPILPEFAAGYAPATVVVIRSDRLVALDDAKREALMGWIGAGGTLAVVPTRPEDLRSPVLATLVGGDAAAAPPPPQMMTLPAYAKPPAATLDATSGGAQKHAKPAPAEETKVSAGPTEAIRAQLTGYAGGVLAPSDFGATAPYGLGEVHLLALDPTSPQNADDPWVDTRVIELVRHAWDRRARSAFAIGSGAHGMRHGDAMARALDPNDGFRGALGASALILLLYSVLVGPVVFARAAKRDAPLAPLIYVPLWSAAAFAAIVAVGVAEKGWHGRARRVTILEAGSGAGRATLRSYRGYFSSDVHSLAVAPLQRASVLESSSEGILGRQSDGVLRVERDGVTLFGLSSLPWQTVVVREDGVTELGAGIALVTSAGGGLEVVNQSGRALKDVIVTGPRDGAYFASIADGARVALSAGRPVFSLGSSSAMAGKLTVHPLLAEMFPSSLGPDGARIAAEWEPFEAATGNTTDWWPEDTPVLMAELISPSRRAEDSGLALDSDRTFIRVVGTAEAKR